MFDQIALLNDDQLVFLAVMTGMILTAGTIVAGICAVQFRRFRERQLELGFREEMLRQGLSVDDVVCLLSAKRPTWSRSLMTMGDWALQKVSHAGDVIAAKTPLVLRRCRKHFDRAWNSAEVIGRKTWRIARQTGRIFYREARPLLHQTMKSLSGCMHWASDQTDRLLRRLAPNRL